MGWSAERNLPSAPAVMVIIYQIGRMSIIMYLPCMVLGSLTGINVNILGVARKGQK